MNKTLIIIILSILVLVLGYFLLSNKNAKTDLKTLEDKNRKDKDSLTTLFNRTQRSYALKEKQLEALEGELLTEKGKVKRSEQKLSEVLKRERHAQIENKKVFRYSNFQLDSSFRVLFPVPDSLRY